MLFLQERVLPLEHLELDDLARRPGGCGLRQAPAQSAVADVLPPLRQHERLNVERGGDSLHLQVRLVTQPHRRELEVPAVLGDPTGSGPGHVTPQSLGRSVNESGARSAVCTNLR